MRKRGINIPLFFIVLIDNACSNESREARDAISKRCQFSEEFSSFSADTIHINKRLVRDGDTSLPTRTNLLYSYNIAQLAMWHYRFITDFDTADSIYGVTSVVPVILLFKSS